MHERQAIVVVSLLLFSVIFVSESFAQVSQFNEQASNNAPLEIIGSSEFFAGPYKKEILNF